MPGEDVTSHAVTMAAAAIAERLEAIDETLRLIHKSTLPAPLRGAATRPKQ